MEIPSERLSQMILFLWRRRVNLASSSSPSEDGISVATVVAVSAKALEVPVVP